MTARHSCASQYHANNQHDRDPRALTAQQSCSSTTMLEPVLDGSRAADGATGTGTSRRHTAHELHTRQNILLTGFTDRMSPFIRDTGTLLRESQRLNHGSCHLVVPPGDASVRRRLLCGGGSVTAPAACPHAAPTCRRKRQSAVVHQQADGRLLVRLAPELPHMLWAASVCAQGCVSPKLCDVAVQSAHMFREHHNDVDVLSGGLPAEAAIGECRRPVKKTHRWCAIRTHSICCRRPAHSIDPPLSLGGEVRQKKIGQKLFIAPVGHRAEHRGAVLTAGGLPVVAACQRGGVESVVVLRDDLLRQLRCIPVEVVALVQKAPSSLKSRWVNSRL